MAADIRIAPCPSLTGLTVSESARWRPWKVYLHFNSFTVAFATLRECEGLKKTSCRSCVWRGGTVETPSMRLPSIKCLVHSFFDILFRTGRLENGHDSRPYCNFTLKTFHGSIIDQQLMMTDVRCGADLFLCKTKVAAPMPISVGGSQEFRAKYSRDALRTLVEEGRISEASHLGRQLLAVNSSDRDALHALADIYAAAARYADALPFAEASFKLDNSPSSLLAYCGILLRLGDGDRLSGLIEACLEMTCKCGDIEGLNDARVLLGRLLVKRRLLNEALHIFRLVSQETNKQHHDAIFHYAVIGRELGEVSIDDAVLILLNLASRPGAKEEVLLQFSNQMQQHGSMQSLRTHLAAAWHVPSAIMYLVNILRCHGALREAEELARRVIRLAPDTAAYVLFSMHLYENLNQPKSALRVAVDFVTRNTGCPVISRLGLTDAFLPFLKTLIDNFTNISQLNAEDCWPSQSASDENAGKYSPDSYNDQELQLVGILFTIVKLVQMQGGTSAVLMPLISSLSPLEHACAFHKTDIVNEHAFFSCIKPLHTHHPLSRCTTAHAAGHRRVYFIGDSHVVPVAHRHIHRNQALSIEVRPLLVTGVKIWHLRDSGCFYTKAAFWDAVNTSVPDCSDVVLVMGEIDCRDGVLSAVRKCKYDCVKDGIAALVAVYVEVLRRLVNDKNLTVFVHPVVPVLSATKAIVMQWNAALKATLENVSGVKWLDVLGCLLDAHGDVKQEFHLDGVHVNPSYLTHLTQEHFTSA